MLVAGWYIQTRALIAYEEALSRKRVAAIEKGVPLPDRKPEPPKPPVRAVHPLKPTLAVLAIGIALLFASRRLTVCGGWSSLLWALPAWFIGSSRAGMSGSDSKS